MTEKEAIEVIRDKACNDRCEEIHCNDACMYGKDKCAFDMAIQALEKQTMVNEILNELKSTPVLRGEWEVVQGVLTPGGDPLLRCPFCKSRESEHLGGIELPVNWNYCPKCGVDLRGKEHT